MGHRQDRGNTIGAVASLIFHPFPVCRFPDLKHIVELLQSGRGLLNHVVTVLSACASGSMCISSFFEPTWFPCRLSSWETGGVVLAGAASFPFLLYRPPIDWLSMLLPMLLSNV